MKNRLTVQDVSRLTGMSESTVRKGLRDGVFGFGCAVKTSSHWTYVVYADKFTQVTGINYENK